MVGHRQEERIRTDERSRVEEELRQLSGDDAPPDQVDPFDAPPRPEERVDDGAVVERTIPVAPTVAAPVAVAPDDRPVDDRPVAEPAVAEPAVAEPTVVAPQAIEVMRQRSFSVGQFVSLIAGLALLALGITAMITTGLRTPWDEPVKSVFGWNHTPWLGVLETAAGALLVLFSLRPGGRWIVGLVGLALVGGGILILNEVDWTVDKLGAERDFGWMPVVVGGVVVLAALLTPRRYQRMTGTPVEPLDVVAAR